MDKTTNDNTLPTLDQARYYDQRWRKFDYGNLYSLERCVFALKMLLEIGLDQPRICDLGSGSGWLSGVLSAFGPTVGVELSPEAVELARQRFPRATFVCADATQWEPTPGEFDVVVSQEVLEHIVDKPAYLRVARQALRPGGHLVITTPNLRVLNSLPKIERETIWEIQPVELPVDRRQLNRLLELAGFEVIYQSSAVAGVGKFGVQRILNSTKVSLLLELAGLQRVWQSLRLRNDFGMYLTTLARAPRS